MALSSNTTAVSARQWMCEALVKLEAFASNAVKSPLSRCVSALGETPNKIHKSA